MKATEKDKELREKLWILVGKKIENPEENVVGVITDVFSFNDATAIAMVVKDEWLGEYYLSTTHLLGGVTLVKFLGKPEEFKVGSGRPLLSKTLIGGRTFENAMKFVFDQE